MPAHAQLVTPFVTSAVAAAAALSKITAARTEPSGGRGAATPGGTEPNPTARWGEPQPRAAAEPSPSGSATDPVPSANSDSPASPSHDTTAPTPVPAMTDAHAADTPSRNRQQRRGVIIHQQRKARPQ